MRLYGASGKWLAEDRVLLFEIRVKYRQVLLRLLPHLRVPVRVPALLAASNLRRDLSTAFLGDPEAQLFVVPPITVEPNGASLSAYVNWGRWNGLTVLVRRYPGACPEEMSRT